MRGVLLLAVSLFGLSLSWGGISYNYIDNNDTTMYIYNYSGGVPLALQGAGSATVLQVTSSSGGTSVAVGGGGDTGVSSFGYYVGLKGTSGYGDGPGVKGIGRDTGVSGNATSGTGVGVYGYSPQWVGVFGEGDVAGVSGEGFSGVEGVATQVGGQGILGIGQAANSWAGRFYGNVGVFGACNPCSPSDSRFKKNVSPITNGLQKILALKPKSYEMKTEEFKELHFSKGVTYGLMAEEVVQVLPEMVHSMRLPAKDKDGRVAKDAAGEEYKALSYSTLIPLLIQAIQEQQAEIEALKKAR